MRSVWPRSSRPVSGIRAARRAMSVIGRRPTDASQSPPPPASSSAIGIPTSIASCDFALLAQHVRQRAADHEHERESAPNACGTRVHAPRRRRRSRRSRRAAARRGHGSGARSVEPVPARGQHVAVRVEDRQRAPGRVDGSRSPRPRRAPASSFSFSSSCTTLPSVVVSAVELAVDAADADPPLLPQHGRRRTGTSTTQQRERVPERQPRPQRQRASWRVVLRPPADSLRRAACGSATPLPVDRACAAAAARRRRRRSTADRSARPRRARRCRARLTTSPARRTRYSSRAYSFAVSGTSRVADAHAGGCACRSPAARPSAARAAAAGGRGGRARAAARAARRSRTA